MEQEIFKLIKQHKHEITVKVDLFDDEDIEDWFYYADDFVLNVHDYDEDGIIDIQAYGYDKDTVRWGYQQGLSDTNNTLVIGTDGNSAFAGYVFTETAHGAKPVTGEFAVQGAMYTANSGDIWIYS